MLLCPQVDLDWDSPAQNVPHGAGDISPQGLGRWDPNADAVSRADIGSTCDNTGSAPCHPDAPIGPNRTVLPDTAWVAWFAAYAGFVGHYLKIADAHSTTVEVIDLGFGLDTALLHPPNLQRWLSLVSDARAAFRGKVTMTASATVASKVPKALWVAVDMVGVDGTAVSLAAAPYLARNAVSGGLNTTVADERVVVTPDSVSAAWKSPLDLLAELSTGVNRPLLVTKVGYQSRPNCVVRPAGVPRLDCGLDCSCWMLCRDPQCQASAFEGFASAVQALPPSVMAGVYWLGWTTDPTAGGPSDMGYTPFGKPAEAVMRAMFSNDTATDSHHHLAAVHESSQQLRIELDRRTAYFAARGRTSARATIQAGVALDDGTTASARLGVAPPRRLNGFVFGAGEWSHPDTSVAEAMLSLDSLAETGANSVEFVPMWFFDSQNSTEIYPIGWGCDLGPEDAGQVSPFPPTTACNRTADPLRSIRDSDLTQLIV